MTGKVSHFSSFQGFPGPVGALPVFRIGFVDALHVGTAYDPRAARKRKAGLSAGLPVYN